MKTCLKIIGVVFLLELFFFPLFYYVLWPNTNTLAGNWLLLAVRILSGLGIGLWFASRNRLSAVDADCQKRAVLISAAALVFAVFYTFSSLYAPLYDLFWYGAQTAGMNPFDHPVRLFLSENLFDQTAVASYMCLLIAFQFGRLPASPARAAA